MFLIGVLRLHHLQYAEIMSNRFPMQIQLWGAGKCNDSVREKGGSAFCCMSIGETLFVHLLE